MKPLIALLGELRRAGVRVWAEGEALRYRAPPGGLSAELLAELRGRKAEILAFCRQAGAEPEAPRLEPAPRLAAPAMSPAQRRLWILSRLREEDPSYNIPLALRLRGELDLPALRRSLGALLRRHAALRTAFLAEGGEARPEIAATCPLPWDETDLQHLPEAGRLAEARRQVCEEALRPFDLGQAPLVRFRLWRLGGQDHVLLMVTHHIVSDGRSIEVLAEELAALYRAEREGGEAALPPLPADYADFAWHQRRRLTDALLGEQLGYWRRQLDGLPPLLELPLDRARPAVASATGASLRQPLPAELVQRLRRLGQGSGATLYLVLLAGLAAVLGRHSGRDDIPIACPATYRTRPELDRLVGFLVNTLVLRLDLAGNPRFGELLQRARATVAAGFAHQDVPFDLVVEALRVERSPGYPPLAQVSLAMLDAEAARPRLAGLETEPFDFGASVARYDLTIEAHAAAEGLELHWIYATALFDTATVRRMAGHLRQLLEAAAAEPERRLAELPLLTPEELEETTRRWNATAAPPPPVPFVHRAFEAQAAREPEAVALRFGDRVLTYGALNRRANRLAHRLMALGVGPDRPVGLCLPRSFGLVVGVLAVLKAGGAYVPLDPAHPGQRRLGMLRDCGAGVVLTDAGWGAELAAAGWPGRCLDPEAEDPAAEPEENPAPPLAAANLAYVMYTSGSTGQPKGCQIEHRNLMHYLGWASRHFYPDGRGGAFGLFTSLAFDLTVTSLFLPLIRGRSLRILPQDAPLDTVLRAVFGPESGLDSVKLTPAHISLLAGLELPPTAVALAVVGGEQLLPEQVATLRRLNPRMRILNEYGPTEATVGCVAREILPGEARILIGRPIDNTRVHVLDPQGRPQPVGVPGELHIGGAGLARGYLNRPELTAERFIPDPFSPEPGARLYRSGDLARWTATGELECLGRLDHQVKIRGFRVELGEIEAAIATHPAVRQAAVLAPGEGASGRHLVAYVAAAPAPTAEALRGHLRGSLPDHMLPARLVILDSLPLTPNGKIDRAALPRLDPGEAAPVAAAPRTRAEAVLAEIWARLLRLERVGIHDDFFQLGGDSILGIQMVGRANQAGLRLAPGLLLHHPTIAGLAAAAEAAGPAAPARAAAPGPVPLTPIQHWFFEQSLPEPHHFNQSLLLELHEPLPPELLEEALRHLIRHHDALRLRFRRGAAGWTQELVQPGEAVALTRIDLSAVADAGLGAAIEAEAARLQTGLRLDGKPLDLAHLDCGPGRPPRLLWVIHHLVVDSVSWRILLEDLFTACRQLRRGDAPRLPPATTSFRSWAERLADFAGSEALARERALWLPETPTPALRLPLDRTNGPDSQASARVVALALPPEETDRLLRGALPCLGAPVREVLLAALAEALFPWVGPGLLPIDLEGHGREPVFPDLDLTRSVGWFASFTPFMLPLGPEDGPAVARRLRAQLQGLPNAGLGYGVLRYLGDDAELARRLRQGPRPEICFNYLGQVDQPEPVPFAVARESSGPEAAPGGARPHLLRLDGRVEAGRLHLRLQYGANRHEAGSIEKLGGALVQALRSMLVQCQASGIGTMLPARPPAAGLDREELNKVARLLDAVRAR